MTFCLQSFEVTLDGRLPLLPTLLRVEPLLPSPLWSLALHHGFWIPDLNRVITIDGKVLPINEIVDEHVRPVRDWSAHTWGLEWADADQPPISVRP